MTQADEGGHRAATTRVVYIKNSYGSGKGQFIRFAGIENGCVKWLIFGMTKPTRPAFGVGGPSRHPPAIASPIQATLWLVCGTAAVEQILSGATQDAYNEILNSLREALLMRSGTSLEIFQQSSAIAGALNKSILNSQGSTIKFDYKTTGEALKWWEQNFGFLYEKSFWEMAHQNLTP